jgi:hypothetical protein
MTLKEEVVKLFSEQTEEDGALEKKVEESFKTTLPQYELTSGSIKIEKIDTVKDIITGSLKYRIAGLNVNTMFLFKSGDGILILGEI